MDNFFQFLILLIGHIFFVCLADLSCKGLDGHDVDWFVGIKYPKMRDSNRYISDGVGFLYADNRNSTFVLSNLPISDPQSAIGRTVNQIFEAKNKKNIFYAVYNDKIPNVKPYSYKGHLKGALSFDDFQGFWLIHSVPQFPDTSLSRYTYPLSGVKFGQSFMCVTFPVTTLNDIADQFLFMQPSIYDFNLPESFQKSSPSLVKVIAQKSLPRLAKSYSNVVKLVSKEGTEFTSFAKHKKFGNESPLDLYDSLVAPAFRRSFFVETWLNGIGDLGPSCDKAKHVLDVNRLQFIGKTFTNAKDHSKWGISNSVKKAAVCIGDINRQSSQEHRGGGTLCIENKQFFPFYNVLEDICKVETDNFLGLGFDIQKFDEKKLKTKTIEYIKAGNPPFPFNRIILSKSPVCRWNLNKGNCTVLLAQTNFNAAYFTINNKFYYWLVLFKVKSQ